jgi:hypothetical protein
MGQENRPANGAGAVLAGWCVGRSCFSSSQTATCGPSYEELLAGMVAGGEFISLASPRVRSAAHFKHPPYNVNCRRVVLVLIPASPSRLASSTHNPPYEQWLVGLALS